MMHECDVLIIGGGPAGSSCAWGLRHSGLRVMVLDRASFPRDKTCAGWVTPPVWKLLQVNPEDYARERTLQPITGFMTGILGGKLTETSYPDVVSYGIRRCEFDHFLLQRCTAELMTGVPADSIERDGRWWVVNHEIRARVLVGAGGNFCPVSKMMLGTEQSSVPLVRAQEIEFAVEPDLLARLSVSGGVPVLYFCQDMNGYGWCFRKGDYLNIGLGHTDPRRLKNDLAELLEQVRQQIGLVQPFPGHMHGHAYRLSCGRQPETTGDGWLLIGDSAGLADPRSGEGIRLAVESGLVAAKLLEETRGDFQKSQLRPYAAWVTRRWSHRGLSSNGLLQSFITTSQMMIGRRLLRSRWFTRHVLLNRWFLHRDNLSTEPVQPVNEA